MVLQTESEAAAVKILLGTANAALAELRGSGVNTSIRFVSSCLTSFQRATPYLLTFSFAGPALFARNGSASLPKLLRIPSVICCSVLACVRLQRLRSQLQSQRTEQPRCSLSWLYRLGYDQSWARMCLVK
jgi:hypothetical protein